MINGKFIVCYNLFMIISPLNLKKKTFKKEAHKEYRAFYDRCCALRANKQQTTRRKKKVIVLAHILKVFPRRTKRSSTKKDSQSKTSICSGNKGIVYWIEDMFNV